MQKKGLTYLLKSAKGRAMRTEDKITNYIDAIEEISAVLEGETSVISQMATIACILKKSFSYYYWCGFYIVDPLKDRELFVGPYQGTLGCLRIPFGKGVCGEVAATGKTKIVKDVHAIANHIACDPISTSEIVVPVYDKNKKLIAVLDVDSAEVGSFNETDQKYLEELVLKIFQR